MERITSLPKCLTIKHAVLIRKVNRKGELVGVRYYLNYYNGVVRINHSNGQTWKILRGTPEKLLEDLYNLGYRKEAV